MLFYDERKKANRKALKGWEKSNYFCVRLFLSRMITYGCYPSHFSTCEGCTCLYCGIDISGEKIFINKKLLPIHQLDLKVDRIYISIYHLIVCVSCERSMGQLLYSHERSH